MRTRTIYSACEEAERIWNPYRNDNFDYYPSKRVERAERQTRTFYAELLRRMDERDADVRPAKAYRALERLWPIYRDAGNSIHELARTIDRLQTELAEAKAEIKRLTTPGPMLLMTDKEADEYAKAAGTIARIHATRQVRK